MEFQIAEAIELIKTLAESENLTQSAALTVFVAEADLDLESASILKSALYEEYTIQEMAVDTLSNAMNAVFVLVQTGEDIQETDTKETQEGTKYKIRVKDRQSGSSYVRYATRQKVAELRANPNIASVEMTDHGDSGEDDRGDRTAAAKRGDRDGDGKVESGSKEHAGVVHNAIQRKMGGKPDGQDTRREAFDPKGAARMDAAKGKKKETQDEIDKRLMLGKHSPAAKYGKKKEVEEGIDFKGAARKQAAMDAEQKKKDEKSPSSKDRRLMMRKFRPGASKEERAEGGRDSMREKDTSPKKDGKKMFEAYLELRDSKKKVAEETTSEEWKPDPTEKREKKAAKLGREEEIEKGKSKKYGRDEAKIDKLYKRRMGVQFKKKMSEDFVSEADLVDAGRENQAQRDGKKLTGKGVDNKSSIKLMPSIGESIATSRLTSSSVNVGLRQQIQEMGALLDEECCPKCGTPECVCEGKKEGKPKKKKAKIDESGMPILEYSQNNARPGPSPEMINPGKDEEGDVGHMNPKGKPKRYKNKGEAPGDRRPNDPSGPDLPLEKGTVPNGSGV